MITATKEDYLRAIYLLSLEAPASVTDIAARLQLSKSTVSERVKVLVEDGFVSSLPYGAVTLTDTGKQAASVLTYKHRLIEVFLHNVLKIPADQVHNEAEKLEHACSDEVIKRLAVFLNHPPTDPHGTEIHTPKGW